MTTQGIAAAFDEWVSDYLAANPGSRTEVAVLFSMWLSEQTNQPVRMRRLDDDKSLAKSRRV